MLSLYQTDLISIIITLWKVIAFSKGKQMHESTLIFANFVRNYIHNITFYTNEISNPVVNGFLFLTSK